MKRSGLAVVVVWVALGIGAPAAGEVDSKLHAAIEELIERTQAMNLGQQMGDSMVAQFIAFAKQADPDVSPRALEIIGEVVNEELTASLPELTDDTVRLYAEHFTLEEVQAMNRYHASPVGQKAIAVMPEILQGSIQQSQRWVNAIVPRMEQKLAERLAAEGLVLGAGAD